MSRTVDIGRRIELVSMDPHFHEISIALYRQRREEGPAYLVHTYSPIEGAQERVAFVAGAMGVLGGMTSLPEEPRVLRFPCWAEHESACKRVFLEACKLEPNEEVEPRPLGILDKKSNRNITVSSLGSGLYQLAADGEDEGRDRRVAAVAGGLIKLGGMLAVEQRLDQIAFPCGYAHDEMVGLLLVRALNVRAVLREQEKAASRGVLSAPSSRE